MPANRRIGLIGFCHGYGRIAGRTAYPGPRGAGHPAPRGPVASRRGERRPL